MSDAAEKSTQSAPAKDIRSAIQTMSIADIAALIEFAEKVRQEKQEKAQQDLLVELRDRAAAIGISLESLISQAQLEARKSKGGAADEKKLTIKYRGPNGEKWTGRGRTPNWLTALESEGKKREDFAT